MKCHMLFIREAGKVCTTSSCVLMRSGGSCCCRGTSTELPVTESEKLCCKNVCLGHTVHDNGMTMNKFHINNLP